MLPTPPACPKQADLIERLTRIIGSFVQRNVRLYGPFTRVYDVEDVVQQAHLELCQSLGSDYLEQVSA